MNCFVCGKEIERLEEEKEADGGVFIGIKISVNETAPKTPSTIAYMNRQLGKYANTKGGCLVESCYECYIDSLLLGLHNKGRN